MKAPQSSADSKTSNPQTATRVDAQTSHLDVEALKNLPQEELLELFKTLPAPSVDEMDGEYSATLLDQGSWVQNSVGKLALNNPLQGNWQTKAFRPLGGGYGLGYNSFDRSGTTIRIYPMKTSLAKSRFDGRDCYQLDYTAYGSLLGSLNMVDEVRRLGPQLFLGMGTWGFTKKARQRPLPFCLAGPVQPYVGVDKKHRELRPKFTA